MLNDRGVPNPTEYKRLHGLRYKQPTRKNSTLWKYFAISDMLCNEMYIGNMVQGKYGSVSYKTKQNKPRPKDEWYRVEGTHEAIIDRELWDKVQSLIEQNKELLSQFTEWANEMSRQIRHRSYERSLTQSDKKFLADESVTDVDGVDISLGTELDSYDMDDSDSVANTDLLSKLSLLMDMGKKKTKYNVLNLNSKFTVDQKQTLEHVFDALYAKYTNAKANDIIQTIIDSF